MKYTGICILLLAVSALAFYEEGGPVHKLNVETFQTEVLDSEDLWLVEFFAPWCGHCKKLTPEWEKAAKGLKGFFKLGAVDMTTDGDAGKAYDVQGYPTLKFFGADKSVDPIDFEGGRTSAGIINFCTNKIKALANTRIGNKVKAKSTKPNEEKKEEPKQEEQDTGDGDVVVLTEANFPELVEQSNEPWFVEFYAPWCGHCKTLAPIWKKLATSQKGKINIAKVDATENRDLAERFGVKGYPSLKFFPSGPKSDASVEAYDGGRDQDALETFVSKYQPAKFGQLLSQDVYDDFCVNTPGVCIIVYMPPLHDSSNEQRANYINQMETVANNFRGKPYSFLWSEGGAQYEMEDGFGVGGSGYPATIAVTVKKGLYATLRQSFTQANFQNFVDSVGAGKAGFGKFVKQPVVKTVKQWSFEADQKKSDEL